MDQRSRDLALEEGGPTRTTPTRPEQAIDRASPAAEGVVICVRCGAAVALERHRTTAFGAHEHDRVNPAGFMFRIALFAEAAGALPVGPASDEFAWFPRHSWRPALCASCLGHLGWHFAGADGAFYGLIVTAIRTA